MGLFLDRKNLITLGVFIVLAALAMYFGVRPLTFYSINKYKENKDKNASLNQLKIEVDELGKAQKDFESQKSTIEIINSYIPITDTSNFTVEIDALANQTKNHIQSLKFPNDNKVTIPTSGVNSKQYELALKGSYNSIYNFISGLDKLNQFNIVYNVSINYSNNEVIGTIKGIIFNRPGQNTSSSTTSSTNQKSETGVTK